MLNAQNVEFSYVWSKSEIVLKSIILKKRAKYFLNFYHIFILYLDF